MVSNLGRLRAAASQPVDATPTPKPAISLPINKQYKLPDALIIEPTINKALLYSKVGFRPYFSEGLAPRNDPIQAPSKKTVTNIIIV